MNKNENNSRIDPDALFRQARSHFQKRRMEEAASVVQKVLEANPDHPDANHLLGIISGLRGQHDVAIQLISRAITGAPYNPVYHNNLGLALHKLGRLEEALSTCEQAISIAPQNAEAYNTIGNILKDLGRQDEALAAYRQAIRINPNDAIAHYNIGNVLTGLGRLEEALASHGQAVHLRPQYAEAYNNIGNILRNLGRKEEALAAYRRATQSNPDLARAHYNTAVILIGLSRLEEARIACERAILLNPCNADAYNNLGNILADMGYLEKAEESYRRALDLDPGHSASHSNLLFQLAATAKLTSAQLVAELRRWDRTHGEEGRTKQIPIRVLEAASDRRLRVGYVSPDLRKHVVSCFFAPLLAAHDRTGFEIFCYDAGVSPADATTEHLRSIAEHWRIVDDKNDEELARLIHKDRIDVLVDLSGHTANNRLKAFTYKPAQVQVTYLGFFASTGLEAMDYWITDTVLHPLDSREMAAESIYRLPRCWVCYRPPETAPAVSSRPAGDERIVFGCFQKLPKLTSEVIKTWSQLLHELPGSRLLLMSAPLTSQGIQQLILDRFAHHGVLPEQLLFRKGASFEQYLATYAEVDIVLDTFPRTGGTTTAEALWMGVPVVTLAGDRYVERISASKLTSIGLEELITHSQEEYISRVISLAHDQALRSDLRSSLRARVARSPLCNAESLARAMEAAYTSMWRNRDTACGADTTTDE